MRERRDEMLAFIKSNGTVTFSQLVALFPDVSEMTIRKDLKFLDEKGAIVRIHGGARSIDTVVPHDPPLSKRLTYHMEEKQQIAQKARKLIPEGSSIFLDSGSTMTQLAKVFPDQKGMVFTGGLTCINELVTLTETEIYVLGGRLNKGSLSVRDIAMASMVEELHFDIAFISVNGFTREKGFTCRSSFRWELEKTILRRASKVIVLMDGSKVGTTHPFSICMPKEIDVLVSDGSLDEDTKRFLLDQGVEVL